jgi:hypothetical protein
LSQPPPIDYARRANSPLGLALLILLPLGAVLAVLSAVIARPAVGRHAPLIGFGAALVGLVVAGYLSWRWAGQPLLARFNLFMSSIATVLEGCRPRWKRGLKLPHLPNELILALDGFLVPVCVVGMVVTLLWMTGHYHFDRPMYWRHRVEVWEIPGSDHTDKNDYYQAWCACHWRSGQYRLRQPDAEAQAFDAARKHSTKVARRVRYAVTSSG